MGDFELLLIDCENGEQVLFVVSLEIVLPFVVLDFNSLVLAIVLLLVLTF